MPDKAPSINLQKLQQDLRQVADDLGSLIELGSRPVSELFGSSDSPSPRPPATQSRISPEAMERIREANQKMWIKCSRPECKGVRHRKSHPHITGGKKKSA